MTHPIKYYFLSYMSWMSATKWGHGNCWVKFGDHPKNLIIALERAGAEIAGTKTSETTLISWQEITEEQYEAFVESKKLKE